MILRSLAAAGAALLALTVPGAAQQNLADPGSDFVDDRPQGNWHAVIAKTERGHLIGDPDADTRLIEFVSYTCSHCANFAIQGEPALDLTLLMPGKMAVEVRPVIRNALDLTVTLLAQCGEIRPALRIVTAPSCTARRTGSPRSRARRKASRRSGAARATRPSRPMNAANALGLSDMLVKARPAAVPSQCLRDG